MAFFESIADAVNSTQVPVQLSEVDYAGLFSNPWFMVPFVGMVGYMFFKQAFTGLILLGVGVGLWIFSGSDMVRLASVDGEIQADKLLPVIFVGVGAMAIVVYVLFGRSD